MNLKGEPVEQFGPLRAWLYRKFAEPTLKPLHLRIGAEIPIEEGRMLDVGCGPGNLDRLLAAARPKLEIVGVDESPAMLRQAVRGPRLPNLDFRLTPAESIDFREEFDFAISVLTFHHWEEPVRGLEAVYRALKPGGRFWIYEPNPDSSDEDLRRDQARLGGWFRMPLGLLRRGLRHHGFSLEEADLLVLPAVAETSFQRAQVVTRGSTIRVSLVRDGGEPA